MKTSFALLVKKASDALVSISDTPLLDVEILLAHSLGTTREQLILNPPKTIDTDTVSLFAHLVQKRSIGIPVAYLIGTKSFYESDFIVNEHVLIPRPETEHIVEKGLHIVLAEESPTMLDVGTGSGCIPISIAKYAPHTRIIATDVSTQALAVAFLNAEREEVEEQITFLESNLIEEIPKMNFTLITANLPYLPTHDAKKTSLEYGEPFEALNGGILGIELYQVFFKQLRTKKFKHLLVECDPRHARQLQQSARDIFTDKTVDTFKDLSGTYRGLHIH